MNQKTYIKKVCKQLKCTRTKRIEIAKQLESDITSAMANGETMEQIVERMGAPKDIAAEFNENLSEEEIKRAKRAKKITIAGIIVVVLLILGLLGYWAVPKSKPLEESSIFDVEQVESKSMAVILALNMEDYDALQEEYADENMKPILTKEYMDNVKAGFDLDWKSNVSYGNAYAVEVSQLGKIYAVVQMTVGYGENNVTYTLSFDSDYKLAGLYMK
jgi:hypothetical protein